MPGLRAAKTVDLCVQVVAVGVILLFYATGKNGRYTLGMVVLIAWQVLSMIMHQFNGQLAHRDSFRWWFHRAVLILVVVFGTQLILAFLSGSWVPLIFGYAVLLAAPVMAIVHLLMCATELRQLPRDP